MKVTKKQKAEDFIKEGLSTLGLEKGQVLVELAKIVIAINNSNTEMLVSKAQVGRYLTKQKYSSKQNYKNYEQCYFINKEIL